jgi:hypothetical protein
MAADLDNYITGHYGEDQFKNMDKIDEEPREARFWVFINGSPVRLKLKKNKTYYWGQCKSTDEGYHIRSESYYFDGEKVTSEVIDEGKDCDGRLIHGGRYNFDYLLYYSGSGVFSEGRLYPDWTAIEEYPIYDEFGRNMNY